jgi:hypothetical protein
MVIVWAGLLILLMPAEPWAAPQRPGVSTPKPRNVVSASPVMLTAVVPLPKPRPLEAPRTAVIPAIADSPAGSDAPAPPVPSACQRGLTEEIAVAPGIPDIHGPGGCGGEDLVRLEAIILPGGNRVSVSPPAILRCPMASAVADWVRIDVAPLAASLGAAINGLDNFDSFECRGRNRVVGAKLSEHGRANALDVRALKLANGRSLALTDRGLSREFRERVLQSVCARFSTVLGPGSDGYHEEHVHLDLMERRNNYRICQWDVWDPLPQIAPQLPPERPEQAPPRVIAANSRPAKSDAAISPDTDSARAGEVSTTKKRR